MSRRLLTLKLTCAQKTTNNELSGYVISANSKVVLQIAWEHSRKIPVLINRATFYPIRIYGEYEGGSTLNLSFSVKDEISIAYAWERVFMETRRKMWCDRHYNKYYNERAVHWPAGWQEGKNARAAIDSMAGRAHDKVFDRRAGITILDGGKRGPAPTTPKYLSSPPNEDFSYVKGSRCFHPAAAKIVQKYRDGFNAVVVFPGSEIDKLLQEAYYSKRPKQKE